MTDDIQMPIDVDTSDLKEKLASFVDNLTRIDVAREANNDIIKDIKNMGINPSMARKAAKIMYEQNKEEVDEAHQELMGLVDMVN